MQTGTFLDALSTLPMSTEVKFKHARHEGAESKPTTVAEVMAENMIRPRGNPMRLFGTEEITIHERVKPDDAAPGGFRRWVECVAWPT